MREILVAAVIGLGAVTSSQIVLASPAGGHVGVITQVPERAAIQNADWYWDHGRRYWREDRHPSYHARYEWQGRHYDHRQWERDHWRYW
jgi:hypothetical protein